MASQENLDAETEKEAILLDTHNREAVKNDDIAGNESKEKDKVELNENSSRRWGPHLSTKAEAEAYLRDLTDFPNVAALYAADARLMAVRNERKTCKKTERNKMDGGNNAALPSQISNIAGECVGNTLLSAGEQIEPAIEANASLSGLMTDPYSSRLKGVKESADAGRSNLDAVEDAANETPKISNAAGGYADRTLLLGELTEPANAGNATKPALIIDLVCSCLEGEDESADAGFSSLDAIEDAREEATMIAEENSFTNITKNGQPSGINAGIGRRLSLDAEPLERKNVVPVKLLRGPRYFDPIYIGQKACYKCGEAKHIPAYCVAAKKKNKPCFICGYLGHEGKHCKKVNKCFFCSRRGHLAKDCPKKDIVSEHTSYFCLRCADTGHDMFSCSNNYCPDDLERIPCLVCKALGHVCCANIGNEEGPTSVSCYSCGQFGHQGPECMKLHDNSNGTERSLLNHKNGDEGRKAKKRKKHKKAKEVVQHL